MTSDTTKLDKVLDTLNLEEQQEDSVEAHRGSFFDELPPDETLFERIREYDDLTKHLVRKESWLKVARKLREKKRSSLRILTLPGRHRLEVGLYLDERILECTEDQGGTLVVPVVGFETSPDVFGLLTAMKPRLERLFHGDLITALTSPKAQNHRELRSLFPFDIVNLDLTVNLVAPSEGPYGPVLVAIREIFMLQSARSEDWSLMITFRAGLDATDPEAVQQLKRQYQENIDKHSQVLDACFERYKVTTAEKLYTKSPEEALGQFTAKWLVDLAHTFDWGGSIFKPCTVRSNSRATSLFDPKAGLPILEANASATYYSKQAHDCKLAGRRYRSRSEELHLNQLSRETQQATGGEAQLRQYLKG